jgi:CelD/BcsL family acetyltransferase involved in cellulose biosynthesis
MSGSNQFRSSGITVEAIRGDSHGIDALVPEWRELARDAVNDLPFYHPEWIQAHLRAFEPSAKIALICVRTDGQLDAVLPLIEERAVIKGIPVRKLRAPANVHTPRFDFLLRKTARSDDVISALWAFIQTRLRWDVMEMRNVPDGGVIDLLFHRAMKDNESVGKTVAQRSPYLPLPQECGEDGLPKGLKPSFRKDLRRCLRQLSEQGEVKLRRVTRADAEALRNFYLLEDSGWKGSEASSISASPGTKAFYDAIAAEGENQKYLSLYFLDLNDTPIAAHFGIFYQGWYASLKWAYDEKYSRYSPGHLIISEIFRDLVERDGQEIDLLGNWSEAKSKWASETRQHAFLYFFNNTIKGRLSRIMKFQVTPTLRKLLKRTDQ